MIALIILVIHLVIGLFIAVNMYLDGGSKDDSALYILGWPFFIIGIVLILVWLGLNIATEFIGEKILKRRGK